jgi:hypothetical protein
MKKGILVFTVALLFAAFFPQPVTAAVDLGIKGGVSLASYKWSDDTSASNSLTSPVFGIFAAFNFSKTFAIQPEAYWLTLGGKEIDDSDVDIYEYRMLLNYIHVPILAKVRLMPNGKLTPILFAGPAVGFLMSAKQKFYINDVFEDDEDIKQYLKSTNFSAVFGAGLEVVMNKLMLALDVRYDMGLANINNMGTDTLKIRTLMFMVGVGF